MIRVRRRTGGAPLWQAQIPPSSFEPPRGFWSKDGSRLLLETEGPRGLQLRDARTGRLIRTLTSSGYLGRQPLSPDGAALVLSDRRGARIVHSTTGAHRTLTASARLERPAWSPDGRQIAGTTGRGIEILDVETGRARTIPVGGVFETAWSPSSRFLAAYGSGAGDEWQTTVIDTTSGRTVKVGRFAQGEERAEIAWAADGQRVAYQVARPVR